MSGEIVDEEVVDCLDGCNIDDDLKYVFFEMLSEDPDDRPRIEELLDKI